jgi:hypothetical protein
MHGTVTFLGLDVRVNGRWQPVPAATRASQWVTPSLQDTLGPGTAGGLTWKFSAGRGTPPALVVHDRPPRLPAVSSVRAGPDTVAGLDGAGLPVNVGSVVPNVPGVTGDATVFDLDYALRAVSGDPGAATYQVWVRGDQARIRAGLAASHVGVLSVQRTSSVQSRLRRQGPGLAAVLFLADAGAAAILAALATVVSLTAAARRRRYEYAALAAAGANRRTLFVALALEQVIVSVFAMITGVVAGVAATLLAGHSVPEFVVQPPSSLVQHTPAWLPIIGTLALGVLVVVGAGVAAAAALVRLATPDQLREGS